MFVHKFRANNIFRSHKKIWKIIYKHRLSGCTSQNFISNFLILFIRKYLCIFIMIHIHLWLPKHHFPQIVSAIKICVHVGLARSFHAMKCHSHIRPRARSRYASLLQMINRQCFSYSNTTSCWKWALIKDSRINLECTKIYKYKYPTSNEEDGAQAEWRAHTG
jgi:hypothetical protein